MTKLFLYVALAIIGTVSFGSVSVADAVVTVDSEILEVDLQQTNFQLDDTAEVLVDLDNQGQACDGQTFASAEEALQSGCCSHHNGVCGCRNGRKVCCDRTLSPSCRC